MRGLEVSSVSPNLIHDKALWPHLTSENFFACLFVVVVPVTYKVTMFCYTCFVAFFISS